MTGSVQSETQVAWAKKATRNLLGEVRILSKRESVPLSSVMRLKRNVPTVQMSVHYSQSYLYRTRKRVTFTYVA
jgi:hypothetical protein